MNLIFCSAVLFAAATLTASFPAGPGLLGDPLTMGGDIFGLHNSPHQGPFGGANLLPQGLLGQHGPFGFLKGPLGQHKLPLPFNFLGGHGGFPFGGELGGEKAEAAASETVVSTATQTSSAEGVQSGEGATAAAAVATSSAAASS